MNWIYCLFLLFVAGTSFANQTLLVDPYFSPYSGEANLLFAQNLLIEGRDALFNDSYEKSQDIFAINLNSFSKTLIFVPKDNFTPIFDISLLEEETEKKTTVTLSTFR
ncbi:MAG: hypothetical protein KDK71_03770 [Chlamydiia bacterium]|nr:hypothetical protein [Chlamydiia bacterium]